MNTQVRNNELQVTFEDDNVTLHLENTIHDVLRAQQYIKYLRMGAITSSLVDMFEFFSNDSNHL
jgi:hypothetical protein